MKKDTPGLLASVVIYGLLYNDPRLNNRYRILAEFIKATVIAEKRWTLSCTELTALVNRRYSLHLPEAVIRKAVRTALPDALGANEHSSYQFNMEIVAGADQMEAEYGRITKYHELLHNLLYDFIQERDNRKLYTREKDALLAELHNYLLDPEYNGPYKEHLTAFIAAHRNNLSYTQYLTGIREGLIIARAVRFTPAPEDLPEWKTPLVIFLSIEHLFTARGYNGDMFKANFDTLYNLVSEINQANRSRFKGPRIQFRYLKETRDEYVRFFLEAMDSLKNGRRRMDANDPSWPAWKQLLDGCKDPKDLVQKMAQFETQLKQMDITLFHFDDASYNHIEYTVNDARSWEKIREGLAGIWEKVDKSRCQHLLDIFSTVNALRQGRLESRLENLRYVFLTNQQLGLYLAQNTRVDFRGDQTPFAVDIEYLTNYLWVRQRKGLAIYNRQPLPPEALARTQAVFLPLVDSRVSDGYDHWQQQLQTGALSEMEALNIIITFHEQSLATEKNIREKALIIPINSVVQDSRREIDHLRALLEDAVAEKNLFREQLSLSTDINRMHEFTFERTAYDLRLDSYCTAEWKKMARTGGRDAWYSLMALGLGFLVGAFTTYLKADKQLDNWLGRLGIAQYGVLGFFIFTSFAEFAGRSYFFNKKRIRNGRRWLYAHLSRKRYKKKKAEALARFEAEFQAQNPCPTHPKD